VVGQVAVAEKSNEVAAIPALLDMMKMDAAVSETSPTKSFSERPMTPSRSRAIGERQSRRGFESFTRFPGRLAA
jgi:hypothetical protein